MGSAGGTRDTRFKSPVNVVCCRPLMSMACLTGYLQSLTVHAKLLSSAQVAVTVAVRQTPNPGWFHFPLMSRGVDPEGGTPNGSHRPPPFRGCLACAEKFNQLDSNQTQMSISRNLR